MPHHRSVGMLVTPAIKKAPSIKAGQNCSTCGATGAVPTMALMSGSGLVRLVQCRGDEINPILSSARRPDLAAHNFGHADCFRTSPLPQSLKLERLHEHRPPTLPVRGSGGTLKNGEWVAAEHRAEERVVAVPVLVDGISVVDDLAEQLDRQQQLLLQQEQQGGRPVQQSPNGREGGGRKRKRETEGHAQLKREYAAGDNPTGFLSRDARRLAAKRQLATAAQQVLQDPDKQLPQLAVLLQLLDDEDAQISRLSMLSLLAVFRDLLPAYRIRPMQDEGDGMDKLSKDVRALRAFEASLLDGYHKYLQALQRALKRSSTGHVPLQQGRVAVKCMAGLLETAPHFNYRTDLLQALVGCLSHKDAQIRATALDGLSALLGGSCGDGDVPTEAVQLIADLVRRLGCVAPSNTLDCLHNLRFPDVSAPVSASGIGRKQKSKAKGKSKKAKDDVDRSFLEAQANVDSVVRSNNQTATLEALFELLFRVLKTCSASGRIQQPNGVQLTGAQFQKKFPLLFPALRLLSKYQRLISLEYLQDILGELRGLLHSNALPIEERLRVLLTVAEMTQHQADVLAAEHAGFFAELFAALKHAMIEPLLEDTSPGRGDTSSSGAQDGDALFTAVCASVERAGSKAGEQVCFLIPTLLEGCLLSNKSLDSSRQAAFAKRMTEMTLAATDTGLALGLLCVLQRMLRRNRKLQNMLQHEAGGPVTHGYHPNAGDPAEACALATPFWELCLLAQHYHPHVAASSAELAASRPAGLIPLAGSAATFAASYSTLTGGFSPAPTNS